MRALPNWDPLQWRGAPVRTLLLLWLATVLGCAHLQKLQHETSALVIAAQETLKACEAEPDPKPRVCEAAERLLAEVEPYVGGVP